MSDLIDRLRGPLPITRIQHPTTTAPEWHTIPNAAVIREWFDEAAVKIEELKNEISRMEKEYQNWSDEHAAMLTLSATRFA